MADHLKEALTKLLDVYDARRRGDLEREQRTKEDEARFLSDFAALRRTVIRPTQGGRVRGVFVPGDNNRQQNSGQTQQ